MTQLTGTVVEARRGETPGGPLTIVDLETGGNGGRRTERLVIAGEAHIAPGTPIRATGVVRRDGAYCLDRGAGRLAVIKRAQAPAAPPPATSRPAARALVPPASASPIPWVDKETRRRIFDRAVEVAREFKEHIRCAKQLLTIQGRKYVTVAGWAILPSFENARCYPTGKPTVLDDGTIIVEAVVEQDGRTVSRGFGSATAKEKPKFHDRLAMSQTRARGSALKARYSVLLTLAGYEPSIAEEVEDARVPDAVGVRPAVVPATEAAPAEAAPTVVIPHPPRPVLAPDERPTEKQVACAVKLFGGSHAAVLAAVAEHGIDAVRVEDVPVPVLKRVVTNLLDLRRRERTDAIGDAAAA